MKILFFSHILEIRDLWPESIVAVEARIPLRIARFLERLERMLYAASTHIVTVGEGYRGRILEKNVPGENVSIVTGGVDPDFCAERRANRRLRSTWGWMTVSSSATSARWAWPADWTLFCAPPKN